ncbi:MAG: YggS family pyridoxal phosphate-dependent enzyme [Candidatus Paracaedibacteraceae bacterium]|nr:YggS family pyridoxal phosphate-dependent enzyme [Candidatus Paracaedibacteraceae bacterium]
MTNFLSLPVDVMAVSKFQPTDAIQDVINKGYRLFGENRVQEAALKWPDLLQRNPQCRLHLIGPLQTNKVRQALQLFQGIETIDRPRLVDEIINHKSSIDCRVSEFLIQVNIGEEPQKAGVMPADFEALLTYCREVNLPISGIMCIPPVNLDPVPYFMAMNALSQAYSLPTTSMGMSSDYNQAIACGSTRIRIGTALFGNRR